MLNRMGELLLYSLRRLRVRAAFLAAAERCAGPFVRTALRAAADRLLALRRVAAACAWRDSARAEAAAEPSRPSARVTARERRGDGLCG